MNASLIRRYFLAAVLGLGGGLAIAATPVTPTKAGPGKPGEAKSVDPLEATRRKIDQLLKARVNPEPLPAVLPNPFTLPNAALTPTDDDGEVRDATAVPAAPADGLEPGSDREILVGFAAGLKISGMVQLNGQRNFIINQLLYKEGDIILMDKRDPKSVVKIVRIAPAELVLGYNDVTHTIRLKN